MATILTERNVSFTSVTLVSLYLASIALTFEVKLNTSVDYQSSLTDFVQYFDEELTSLGDYDIRIGSKGTLAVVPSGRNMYYMLTMQVLQKGIRYV